ncbi:ERV/ALR sulfhydryl oxidase domain-containing protein [Scheffersomyces amazonensis]|uniref:ERV/ALR sulfhydryl oxidase domain-containing protein n=1 Tax=Scheffersomyces amazonensis TaxID=1078765 RepID=UPI00315D6254
MPSATAPIAAEVESTSHSDQKPQIGVTGRKIVYDKDGKPCRTCNTLQDFQFVTAGMKPKLTSPPPSTSNKTVSESAIASPVDTSNKIAGGYAKDYPPDVSELGRSSWTLLHSIAATYPENPSTKEQQDLKQFVKLFGNFYPCWFCRDDFVKYIDKNEPKVETQDNFGKWLCEAHNEVNVKLGKPKFNCNLWKQRWKNGWDNDDN